VRAWHSSKPTAVSGWDVSEMLSTLVTFHIEDETRVVRSSLSPGPAIVAFLDKPAPLSSPPPPEVTIRTAQCVSREMTLFYDYET
jgi:hypothetical protein